jgi:hypothetical protein
MRKQPCCLMRAVARVASGRVHIRSNAVLAVGRFSGALPGGAGLKRCLLTAWCSRWDYVKIECRYSDNLLQLNHCNDADQLAGQSIRVKINTPVSNAASEGNFCSPTQPSETQKSSVVRRTVAYQALTPSVCAISSVARSGSASTGQSVTHSCCSPTARCQPPELNAYRGLCLCLNCLQPLPILTVLSRLP